MAQVSAGLLMFRLFPGPEFFLVHPGGPYYKNKNEGFWTIPKGLVKKEEDLLVAAIREFTEETGIIPSGTFEYLGTVKMKSGKLIHAWSFIGGWDTSSGITSNTFSLEWPPRSGKMIQVPEADKADWFGFDLAMKMIHPVQKVFVEKAKGIYTGIG